MTESTSKHVKEPRRTKRDSSAPVVTVNLRKEFDGLVAVDDLNLEVPRGIIYGMIGPNGSGKTTAIKMLVGLLTPTSGQAFVLRERIPARGKAQRIGYMPQEMAIYTDLTVHENLEFFAGLYCLGPDLFSGREAKLLKMIDLEGRKDSIVSQLSGGMRHRVSLACALIQDPELVFLDEPTVGVDPELRVGLWRHFIDLKSAGKTVIMTTHYMDEAMRCDVVGMMRAGRLIAEGPPQELIRKAGTTDLESAFLEYARRLAK